MKYIAAGLLLSGIFFSCCPEKDKGLYYVIKPIECPDSVECYPYFYGDHNFILHNDTTIYYYGIHRLPHGGCGTGLDPSKPAYLHLYPDSLSEITLQDMEAFLKKKIHNSKHRSHTVVTLASPTDTIRNKGYWRIKKLLLNKKDFLVGAKKCTEEEIHVSKAKFNKTEYNPEKIKWKVGFDDGHIPGTYKTLQFIPPTAEQ